MYQKKSGLALNRTNLVIFIMMALLIISSGCAPKNSNNQNTLTLAKSRMNTDFSEQEFESKKKAAVLIKITAKNKHHYHNSGGQNSQSNGQKFGSFLSKIVSPTAMPTINYFDAVFFKKDEALSVKDRDWFNLAYGKTSNIQYSKNLSYFGISGDTQNTNYNLFMIDPGKYTLNDFSVFNSFRIINGNNHTTFPINYETEFASFEIEEGEVLYLGDLDFHYLYTPNMFSQVKVEDVALKLEDNFEEAKKYLDQNYPSLSSKIKPELLSGRIIRQ